MCQTARASEVLPPTTAEEVHAAALAHVRRVAGVITPSARNAAAFARAVDDVAHASRHLLLALVDDEPGERDAVRAALAPHDRDNGHGHGHAHDGLADHVHAHEHADHGHEHRVVAAV